jgi:hypothetical protein
VSSPLDDQPRSAYGRLGFNRQRRPQLHPLPGPPVPLQEAARLVGRRSDWLLGLRKQGRLGPRSEREQHGVRDDSFLTSYEVVRADIATWLSVGPLGRAVAAWLTGFVVPHRPFLVIRSGNRISVADPDDIQEPIEVRRAGRRLVYEPDPIMAALGLRWDDEPPSEAPPS